MKLSIKAARVNAGLTKKEVAEELGIQERAVTNIENGSVNIKPEYLSKMLTLFNMKETDLDIIKSEIRTVQYKAAVGRKEGE